jgi:hypothetical protein
VILRPEIRERIMGSLYEDTVKRLGKDTLTERAQENAAVAAGEASSAGKTYQPGEATTLRREHAGKYEGLTGFVEQNTVTGQQVGKMRDKSKKAIENDY